MKDKLLKLLKEKSYRTGEYKLSSGKTSKHYINCKPVILSGEGLELVSTMLLKHIESVLKNGNQSMIWLDSYKKGVSIQSLLQKGISEMEQEETNFIQMKSTY